MNTCNTATVAINKATLIGNEQINRFQQLEDAIKHNSSTLQKLTSQEAQLNEYIDIGLEMANQAGLLKLYVIQESWLKRVYTTLSETTTDALKPKPWREMCKEYLYQPLFALKHLYLSGPQLSLIHI